jgi:lipopolysaccharide export system ATP-binding protein
MCANYSSPPILHTRDVSKMYGKRKVVNNVNIRLKGGEIVGLLGPNGAGKTTTFYIVVGLVQASNGSVFLNQTDITNTAMYKRARLGIGYLPQEPSVFAKLTVEQNIRAVAETLSMDRNERELCIQHHLDELHLGHLVHQKAYTLSGGERRRLEISRALVTNPKFLLMDEPFSGVDPISVGDVQQIIISLKKRGIGVLITDHNVRETLRIVNRAYVLHEGRVFFEGSSDFLINDPQCRQFYLGEDFNL